MNSRLVGVAILILGSLGASTARADIIFDNLSQPSVQNLSIYSFGITGDSFSTGSSASLLTDVQVLLEGGGNTSGSITVSLWSDSGGTGPSMTLATLGTLADTDATYAPAVYDFSSFTPIALNADTRYWIVLSSSYSNLGWMFAGDDSGTGVSGEYNYQVGQIYSDTEHPFQMSVSTSVAVPEPSSLLLCGIACVGSLAVQALRGGRAASRP